ncbi:hypothetical protein CNR22_19320 [Sphingobacteriaceae bacterium]|nr:hypothetical protein CNR22_19320 [Sphingobacteriaceae bacterium]
MNILFICDEYPPGKNGGIGTVVQVLGRELVRQGHRVFVVGLYAYSYGQKNYEEDQGVQVWRMRYGLNLKLGADNIIHKIVNKIPGPIKQYLNGRQAFNRYVAFIEKIISDEKIDIVEIPDWNTFAMRIGFLVKWPKFKVPLLLKSHGSYTYFAHEMKEPLKRKLNAIDSALYERADALSAVSLYTASINRKLFGVTREIKVLYNAIENPGIDFKKDKEKETVIFTGSLIAKKGIFQLIKAWRLVHKKHPSAQLIVFGKGDTDLLKKELPVETLSSVSFRGHVSRSELFKTLSTATMAVFPSYSECFALAPMEAMAVGCPVIYTKRSSGKELITDQINGVLIDPDNVTEIAEKISELFKDAARQKTYAENGIETINSKFNLSEIAREHIKHYSQVIINFNS